MRFDLFTPIHKALRRSLFETALTIGRTSFASADEAAAAERAVADCLQFMREHAEHEDRRVLPEIARLDPELAALMVVGHPELERAAIAVESLWPRLAALAATATEERQALGGELMRRFHTFVADEVQHMDLEERELNALFWARLTDAEIMAINKRITDDISPERMRTWGELLLPALNEPERAAMLARAAALAAAAA
jgi:hypothetical protein